MPEDIKYRPSNGTEGVIFCEKYCFNCIHGKYEHTGDTNDKPCDILSRSFLYDLKDKEYPEEWVIKDGFATCTAFKKWDWGRDDDGNFRGLPPEPIIDDPNQLCLPFIFDEIGVPKTELQTV